MGRLMSTRGTTKRKLLGFLVFVVAMFVVIVELGQLWVTNSEPYELGKAAVAKQLGIRPELVQLKTLAPFEFKFSRSSGKAMFVLCGSKTRCFTVVAEKRDVRWSITDLLP